MINRNYYLLLLFMLLPIFSIGAGNSIFSFYGMPWRYYGNDIYGMSMGDVGVSDVFRKNTGYNNPAIIGTTDKTIFATGIMFGWTNYVSDKSSSLTFRDNSLDFPLLSIAIPLRNHRVGFQFTSFSSGVVQNETTIPFENSVLVEKQSIDQYIYKTDLIYAFNMRNISLGTGFNYYFGHDISRFSQDSGNEFFNTSEKLDRSYKNPSISTGFTIKLNKLSIGGLYQHEATLRGNCKRTSIHETEEFGKISYSVPSNFSAGLTALIKEDFKISSDLSYTFWKKAKYNNYTENSWKLGIGLAHDPISGAKNSFLGSMPKRVGLSYRVLPFKAKNKAVTESSISCGISVPVKANDNRLDIGLQYLIRGSTEQNNLQDRSLMFLLGITGFDIFTKPFTRSAPRDIPIIEEID